MLIRFLNFGRTINGAAKERYWFVLCLISWGLFRGFYVVLWLNCLGWRRLVYYCCLWSFSSFLKILFLEWLSILFKLYWSVNVPRGCCQTTSGIDGKFGVSIVCGVSHAAPEWRHGVSKVKFRLQLDYSHLICFEHFSAVPDSVFPAVFFAISQCG